MFGHFDVKVAVLKQCESIKPMYLFVFTCITKRAKLQQWHWCIVMKRASRFDSLVDPSCYPYLLPLCLSRHQNNEIADTSSRWASSEWCLGFRVEIRLGWFGHVSRVPLGCLLSEVCWASQTGRRTKGRPRTCWRGCISWLAWKTLAEWGLGTTTWFAASVTCSHMSNVDGEIIFEGKLVEKLKCSSNLKYYCIIYI